MDDGGIGPIRYPRVSDLNKKIACSYDVLLDYGDGLRGLFLIDMQGVVRHVLINDLLPGSGDAMKCCPARIFGQQRG